MTCDGSQKRKHPKEKKRGICFLFSPQWLFDQRVVFLGSKKVKIVWWADRMEMFLFLTQKKGGQWQILDGLCHRGRFLGTPLHGEERWEAVVLLGNRERERERGRAENLFLSSCVFPPQLNLLSFLTSLYLPVACCSYPIIIIIIIISLASSQPQTGHCPTILSESKRQLSDWEEKVRSWKEKERKKKKTVTLLNHKIKREIWHVDTKPLRRRETACFRRVSFFLAFSFIYFLSGWAAERERDRKGWVPIVQELIELFPFHPYIKTTRSKGRTSAEENKIPTTYLWNRCLKRKSCQFHWLVLRTRQSNSHFTHIRHTKTHQLAFSCTNFNFRGHMVDSCWTFKLFFSSLFYFILFLIYLLPAIVFNIFHILYFNKPRVWVDDTRTWTPHLSRFTVRICLRYRRLNSLS